MQSIDNQLKEGLTLTTSKRTESAHIRREQLLHAARKMFHEKGYDETTISDIVREARVAQGTFYLYYSSKKAIAIALRNSLMETMAEAVNNAIASSNTFEEKLRSLVVASFYIARQNADIYKLAFIGFDDTHPGLHSESPEHSSFLKGITDLFRVAISAGEMKSMNPEIIARLITGLLQHAIIEAFVFGENEESAELEQGVYVLLINALVRKE